MRSRVKGTGCIQSVDQLMGVIARPEQHADDQGRPGQSSCCAAKKGSPDGEAMGVCLSSVLPQI